MLFGVLWSPALQLLHCRTQVAGCHHVHPPPNAVFGNEGVEGVGQHAEEDDNMKIQSTTFELSAVKLSKNNKRALEKLIYIIMCTNSLNE